MITEVSRYVSVLYFAARSRIIRLIGISRRYQLCIYYVTFLTEITVYVYLYENSSPLTKNYTFQDFFSFHLRLQSEFNCVILTHVLSQEKKVGILKGVFIKISNSVLRNKISAIFKSHILLENIIVLLFSKFDFSFVRKKNSI